jgi:hypothetical protein
MAKVIAPVAALPPFVILTLSENAVPTGTLPKSRLLGDRVNFGAGSTPVPARATVATEPLPATVSVADATPAATGLNVTTAVQDVPAAKGDVQVLVTANDDAAEPVSASSRLPEVAAPPL